MQWKLQILGQRDYLWLVYNKSKKVKAGLKSVPELCTYGVRVTDTNYNYF